MGEARRRKRRAAASRGAWQRLRDEAASAVDLAVFDCSVIAIADVPSVISAAIAGDPVARTRATVCLLCDASAENPAAVVVIAPANDNPPATVAASPLGAGCQFATEAELLDGLRSVAEK